MNIKLACCNPSLSNKKEVNSDKKRFIDLFIKEFLKYLYLPLYHHLVKAIYVLFIIMTMTIGYTYIELPLGTRSNHTSSFFLPVLHCPSVPSR